MGIARMRRPSCRFKHTFTHATSQHRLAPRASPKKSHAKVQYPPKRALKPSFNSLMNWRNMSLREIPPPIKGDVARAKVYKIVLGVDREVAGKRPLHPNTSGPARP